MAGYLHRTATTTYPCYLPVLGEFSRSWPYKTCQCKYREREKKGKKRCVIESLKKIFNNQYLMFNKGKPMNRLLTRASQLEASHYPFFFTLVFFISSMISSFVLSAS